MRQTTTWLAAVLVCALATITAAQPQRPQRPQGKQRGEGRWPDQLKQGDVAVDFELKTIDGKKSYQLSDYQGKQPVALIFVSYT